MKLMTCLTLVSLTACLAACASVGDDNEVGTIDTDSDSDYGH
jgi:hypothetical protein